MAWKSIWIKFGDGRGRGEGGVEYLKEGRDDLVGAREKKNAFFF